MVSEIELEQLKLLELRKKLKEISLKPRTIDFQFKNNILCRNSAPRRMIVRREKARINSQISSSLIKIKSLQEII